MWAIKYQLIDSFLHDAYPLENDSSEGTVRAIIVNALKSWDPAQWVNIFVYITSVWRKGIPDSRLRAGPNTGSQNGFDKHLLIHNDTFPQSLVASLLITSFITHNNPGKCTWHEDGPISQISKSILESSCGFHCDTQQTRGKAQLAHHLWSCAPGLLADTQRRSHWKHHRSLW